MKIISASTKHLLVFATILALVGCEEWADRSRYNAPEDHTVSKKKARHMPGLNDPGINCMQCHGADLLGGSVGVSCFECHGKKWTGVGASANVHTVNRGGFLHGAGLTNPSANCASCHGSDLRGGNVGVSCYKCHGELWTGAGSVSHNVNRNGIMHASGLTNPSANCARCHGSDLRGGSVGVSCYRCHGALWSGGTIPHTVNKDGVLHASGLSNPSANCTSCHGSDLRGGSAGVSCYRCHGAEWADDDDDD